MYSHCLFCNRDLGRNRAVAAFPVGRRLAFDAAKGRLWVVCPHCSRWNLTPVEERWEAIEACERLYRDTRRRASTGEIGLAQIGDDVELVRVGRPLRPEFAAWRYGARLRRTARAWRAAATLPTAAMAGATVVAGGLLAAGMTLGAGLAGAGVAGAVVMRRIARGERIALVLPGADGSGLPVRGVDLKAAQLVRAAGALGWAIRLRHVDGVNPTSPLAGLLGTVVTTRLDDALAVRAVDKLLPLVDRRTPRTTTIDDALTLIEAHLDANAADVEAALGRVAVAHAPTGAVFRELPAPVRLAFEIAAHEARERRALDGDLAELHAAWRDAEEIAAIADDLLLPDRVQRSLTHLRRRPPGAAG